MSSTNYSINCPNCSTLIDEEFDSHDGFFCSCYNCGYIRQTVIQQMSLEELNKLRERYNGYGYTDEKLEPLTELPKFNL